MYQFLISRQKISSDDLDKINSISIDEKVNFIYVDGCIPGNDITAWFETKNLGFPFDQATHNSVAEKLSKAGLIHYFQ